MAQYTTEVIMLPDELRYIDSATLIGAYQPFIDATTSPDPSPLTRPIRIVKFVNDSNTGVTISWDGITDHDILPAASFFLYDITANHSNVQGTQGQYIKKGTQFYVKGAAGVGSIYLVCLG